jgi:hypothetical protein
MQLKMLLSEFRVLYSVFHMELSWPQQILADLQIKSGSRTQKETADSVVLPVHYMHFK